MNVINYKSVLGSHEIIIELDILNSNALFSIEKITLSEPVELTLLLKKITYDLKQINICSIILQVSNDDWKEVFENIKDFKFVNTNEIYNFVNISIDIDVFADYLLGQYNMFYLISETGEFFTHE